MTIPRFNVNVKSFDDVRQALQRVGRVFKDMPQSTYNESRVPVATDDVTQGWSVGSIWIMTTGDEDLVGTYRCVDATEGAAVWRKIADVLLDTEGGGSSNPGGGETPDPVVDNQVTRFHETAGRIQGSIVFIDDVGNITGSPTLVQMRLSKSAGQISGGVVTDGGSETVDVSLGTGYLRFSDDATADIVYINWELATGLAIATNTTKYVGVVFTGETIAVEVHDDEDWNGQTGFPLATVINEAGVLHISDHVTHVGDVPRLLAAYFEEVFHVQRANNVGGLILGETGTRNVTVSAGQLNLGLHPFPIAAINTGVAGDFDTYFGSAVKGTTLDAWPNAQYDNAGTLTTMLNNRYANLWFYLETDGGLVMLYGQGQYTTAGMAEEESPPSTVPDRLTEHGILIGRFIFQKSAGTATEIQSAFDIAFSVVGISDHNNLANNGGPGSHATIQSHLDAANPHSGSLSNADEAVTNAKLAHMAQSTMKGRAAAAGTGDATDLSVAQILTILGLTNALKIAIPFYIENPETGKEYPVRSANAAFTITKVKHKTDAGKTCDFQLNIRTTPDVNGTNVFSSAKSSDETYTDETSFSSAAVASESSIAIVFSGTPTAGKIWVFVHGTINA